MRQINPIAKTWANVALHQQQVEKRRIYRKKSIRCAFDFLDGTHRYERTFSDKSVGEFRVMGGREAKTLNEKLFEDYLMAMHKNKKGRSLERWKVVEKFIQDKAQDYQQDKLSEAL
jgi:sarcosine oxidase delta subunit